MRRIEIMVFLISPARSQRDDMPPCILKAAIYVLPLDDSAVDTQKKSATGVPLQFTLGQARAQRRAKQRAK